MPVRKIILTQKLLDKTYKAAVIVSQVDGVVKPRLSHFLEMEQAARETFPTLKPESVFIGHVAEARPYGETNGAPAMFFRLRQGVETPEGWENQESIDFRIKTVPADFPWGEPENG